MKIQPASCCANAYGPHAGRWRIVLLVAAAVLLVAGMIAGRRDSAAATPVVHESYSAQVSDMRDEVSVLVTSRDGSAIPLDQLEAHASYAPQGGEHTAIALEPMKDHLMAGIDPSRAGTLVVNLTTEGARQELTFELPFSTTRRTR